MMAMLFVREVLAPRLAVYIIQFGLLGLPCLRPLLLFVVSLSVFPFVFPRVLEL